MILQSFLGNFLLLSHSETDMGYYTVEDSPTGRDVAADIPLPLHGSVGSVELAVYFGAIVEELVDLVTIDAPVPPAMPFVLHRTLSLALLDILGGFASRQHPGRSDASISVIMSLCGREGSIGLSTMGMGFESADPRSIQFIAETA